MGFGFPGLPAGQASPKWITFPKIFIPVKNINVVRFAVLWNGLTLAGEIYSMVKGYVTFGTIWSNFVITAVFLLAFILFYPWPWKRESYK